MAFAILGNPNPQFADSSGAPYAAGTLEVLEPADDSQKNSYPTYDDAEAETNANDNPITLDARGSCELWGRDAEDYKLVLKDVNGATVWTTDDITMPIEGQGVDAYETAAGVTPNDLSKYPSPVRDASRYVSDNTGATDVLAEIQDAINIEQNEIKFPDGIYLCDGSINPLSETHITGSGYNCVFKLADSADVPLFQFASDDLDYRGVTLEDFRIDGNSANQSSSSASGVFLTNVNGTSGLLARHKLYRLWVLDTKGHGIHMGFAMRDSSVSDCVIYKADEYGFYGQAFSDSSVSTMNVAQSGKNNFHLTSCGRLNVSNSAAWFAGRLDSIGNGYYVEDCGSFNGSGLTAQNNEGYGFHLIGDSGPLEGLNLSGCIADADNKSAGGFSGMRLENVNKGNIGITVRTGNANGTPDDGVVITNNTHDCNIRIASEGQTNREVSGTGIPLNNVVVNGNPGHIVVLEDDFHGATLDGNKWAVDSGSDAEALDPAITVGVDGICRLVTGDDPAATMAANGSQLESALNWRANAHGLGIDVSIKTSAITDLALFVGFTDQTGSLEMPFTLGASNTLTSNASDAVGLLFDTAADDDNWWAVGVDSDVDATHVDSSTPPVAGTYQRLQVAVSNAGAVTFWIDGVQIGSSAMSAAVSPTTPLTPVIAAFSRGAASRNIDVDKIRVQSLRN